MSRKFKFHYNQAGITGTLHEDIRTFMISSRSIFLRVRNILGKTVERIETHVLSSITFFSKNHSVYETIRRIMIDLDRPQTTTP